MINTNKVPNRLIDEKSPYLLQHAYNPVDWLPWGDCAFAEAKRRDLPVFLSIGYSSCHWCHVMEGECFEDQETADLLNKNFVSVKVDREERADIDHLYMEACMALTGSGGWPLSLFLDHERRPFFAGTYFPKEDKQGMSGFLTLLRRISSVWQNNREGIAEAAGELIRHLNKVRDDGKIPDSLAVKLALKQLGSSFDQVHGGFGDAPKFPSVANLLFLLRYDALFGDAFAREMLDKTLTAMAAGGIFDQVGGGFFRYSTDNKWLAPHFEKMLYDNALLLVAYAEAACSIDKKYRLVAERIIAYLLREMLSGEGGFFTAQDADSEGVEGKYYLWTVGEVLAVLGEEEGPAFCEEYDIRAGGNFEGHSIANLSAKRVIAADPRLDKLLAYRNKRVPPLKDDKILASSNGLAIAALAIAGRLLDKPDCLARAEKAALFVLDKLVVENRLMSAWREGVAKHPATLDDHAYLLWGVWELYAATFEPRWLREALALAQKIRELFSDREGGLYLSGKDVADLPLRQKNFRDAVLPSGNAVAALIFSRLALISGDSGLEEAAQGIIRSAWSKLDEMPVYYLGILSAWLFREHSVNVTVRSGEGLPEILAVLKEYRPFINCAVLGEGFKEAERLIAPAAPKTAGDHKAAVYICDRQGCRPPLSDSGELKKGLEKKAWDGVK